MKIFAASLALTVVLAIAQADPITVSGNTIGDLVSVNVNIKADIRNDVHQHFGSAGTTGADLANVWDRIQEVVGKLPLAPSPQVEGESAEEAAPENAPVDSNKVVEQLFGMLSGNPSIWEKLKPLMNHLPKVNEDAAKN